MKRTIVAVLAVVALAGCGGSSDSTTSSPTTTTSDATTPTTSTATVEATDASTADTPTGPPDGWQPTEPTGLDPSADQRTIDNFKSYRNTMNWVVPRSYTLSDENLLGLAVWSCSRRSSGTSELDVALQIPTVVQRLDASQVGWTNEEALQTVYKAETVYCAEYLE